MLEQKIEKRKYKLPIQRTADLGEETVEQFMQRVIDENRRSAWHIDEQFSPAEAARVGKEIHDLL